VLKFAGRRAPIGLKNLIKEKILEVKNITG